MKKYFNIVACLFVALAFGGCNGMDNEPTDKYTDSKFWTSVDKAQYVLNMAYNQLYSAGTMWNDERLSDNVFQGRGFSDQRSMRNGVADPSTGIFKSEWGNLYAGIKTCHVFLENIDAVDGDATVKDNMKAQIRFIRAALYFRLTNLYGDVPFFTQSLTKTEARTIGRTPRAQVISFVHSELDAIMDNLPTSDQLTADRRGEITKGAALTLQARVYLYDGDWPNVEKYCKRVMDGEGGSYDLFNSYSGLFTQANEYNCEVIMDCGYIPSKRTWGEMYDMIPLSMGGRVISTAPTQSLVDNYICLDGKPISTSTMYNPALPYQNRDPRMTATVIYDRYDWSANVGDGSTGVVIYTNPTSGTADAYQGTAANASCTGYYMRKYYDVKHEASMASGLNIITMRYADVLLMYAEAMNEQNKMSEEVWNKTVRPIRVRAGFTLAGALDYPSSQDQAAMRTTLRNERRSELAMEGLRWFDIKRWKAGSEYLNGYVYGAAFGANNANIRLDNYKFDEKRDYLWSIPQKEMDINPNLKPNNPGWSN